MYKLWKIVFMITIVQLVLPLESKYGRYNADEEKLLSVKSKTSKDLGISAWGLVFLIITLILVGVGAYYVAIFYPILCKKERKYDRIELSTI